MASVNNILSAYVATVASPLAAPRHGSPPTLAGSNAGMPTFSPLPGEPTISVPAAAHAGPPRAVTTGADTPSSRAGVGTEQVARQRLIDALSQQSRFNNGLIVVVVVLQVALVLLGALAMYYFRENSDALIKVAGGSVIDLAVFPAGISRLWHDKVTIDMLGAILPNLSTAQAVEMLETLINKK